MALAGERANMQFMTIDFDPEPIILAAAFEVFAHNIRSFKVPLDRAVRRVISPSLTKNFESGGRPAWEPLDADTLSNKSYRGANAPTSPLVFTGRLKRAAGMYSLWSIDGPKGEARISQERLGEVWYGVVHQNGAETRFAQIPKREWALFQPEDMDHIETIFWDWLGERMMAARVASWTP